MSSSMKKSTPAKQTDAEKVADYMRMLEHPLKAEIEAVRTIIKNTDSRISERIKWNAPSYYYKDDFVTFHTRAMKHVHLVFHHPSIVRIQSPLLEGDYKDRRMAYFNDMADVQSKRKELERIIQQLLHFIDQQ
jgi:uncharacterized protein YdhG (YjbR/CyaY superfamily)